MAGEGLVVVVVVVAAVEVRAEVADGVVVVKEEVVLKHMGTPGTVIESYIGSLHNSPHFADQYYIIMFCRYAFYSIPDCYCNYTVFCSYYSV